MQEVVQICQAAADVINEAHRLAQESAGAAVDYAIRCGRLLVEKKKSVPHGEWIPWIEEHCEFSHNRASRYMKAANIALAQHLTSQVSPLPNRGEYPPETCQERCFTHDLDTFVPEFKLN